MISLSSVSNGALSCNITKSCTGTKVLGISDLTNAHAEIFSFNNYPYSICCKDTLGYPIDNQDTGKYISFLKLSSKTDAHVEQSSSNDYNFNAHISSPFYEIKCNYAQSCNGYDTCLVSISGATDAHISVCDYYPINICCTTQCASIETNCIDGLDNDCDGLKDCADSDCDGSIAGTARAQDTNLPIESVDVSTKKDLTVMKSSTTNQQGVYSINQINCGNYTLTTSHTDYAPSFKSAQVLPNQQLTADFSLVLGTSCEADCTFIADNIVHAFCDGKNGCSFYDDISKAACDNSQPGWSRDYNATHYVDCASGAPKPKVEIKAQVSCDKGNLVKVTRIVVYKGKPVKLVVAVCG